MSKQLMFVVVFGLLICAGIIIGHFIADKIRVVKVVPDLTVADNFPTPKPQDLENRIFKSAKMLKEFSIGLRAEDALSNPISVKMDKLGNVYILDWGDLSIKKFSPEGRFTNKFGKGRGQGPGEFQNPTDFKIAMNGDVWICDPSAGIITIFNADGSIKQTMRPKSLPHRIVCLNTGDFILMSTAKTNHLFEIYDPVGKFKSSFGLLLRDQNKYPILTDGWVAIGEDNALYCALVRAGLLASFSSQGVLRFFVETIDRIPLPKIEVFAKGSGMRIDPKAPWAALSLNISDCHIYILSWAGSIGRKGMVVDTYRTADGAYLESFEIPEKCQSTYVTEKFIYTVEDTTVTKWKMEF